MTARLVLALVLVVAAGAPNLAQAQPAWEFFPRFDFRLTAEHLSDPDPRLVWDTNFGGDLDVIDYGRGRATFIANYQAILGEEIRRFDPNQGNYILAGSGSYRAGALEFAGIFYHQSRHLSDRPKRIPVDWNMIGVSAAHTRTTGRLELASRGEVYKVIKRSFVDYRWELDGGTQARVRIVPAVFVISSGSFRLVGVGASPRGVQTGGRGEAGLRLEGRGGAMEFYVAAERRIDPFPLAFGSASWAGVGFRLLSR